MCRIWSYHCLTGEVSVLISVTTGGSLWIKSRAALPNTHLISILVQPSLDRFSKSVPSRKAQASPKLLVPMPMASGALQMSLHFAPISSVQKTVQGPGEKTGASTESTGQAEQLRL